VLLLLAPQRITVLFHLFLILPSLHPFLYIFLERPGSCLDDRKDGRAHHHEDEEAQKHRVDGGSLLAFLFGGEGGERRGRKD